MEFYSPSKYCTLMRVYKVLGYIPTTKCELLCTLGMSSLAISGMLFYFVFIYYKDVYNYEEVHVMEAFHWGTFFVGQALCLFFSIYKRETFVEIDKIIRKGFFDYEEDFTDEMYKIRQDMNDFVLKINKWLYFCVFAGTTSGFTKNTVFQAKPDEWNVLYHGYIPYEITNVWNYSAVLAMNVAHAFFSGAVAYLGMGSFLAVSFHMNAQINLLNVGIRNAVAEKDEEKSLKMLRKCIIHHIEIKRCYLLTIEFFSKALGSMPIYSVILICTFLYDVSDPDGKLGAYVLVFIPELSFITTVCLAGEALSDISDGMANGIYNTLWYERPVRVRKRLLTMMVACNEKMSVSGFDVLPFSRAGLNEVLKGGYTYFNALNAARTLQT